MFARRLPPSPVPPAHESSQDTRDNHCVNELASRQFGSWFNRRRGGRDLAGLYLAGLYLAGVYLANLGYEPISPLRQRLDILRRFPVIAKLLPQGEDVLRQRGLL